MNYKILCADLDGTLLSTKSDVSAFTISEIRRIKPTTKIILVSARMPIAMRYIQRDLGIENEPMICYNGALILDKNKEVYSIYINIEQIALLHQLSSNYDIKLGLYYRDEWYVAESSERVKKEIHHTKANPIYQKTSDTLNDWQKRKIGAHKIMLMGSLDTIDGILPILRAEFDSVMNIYRSNDTLIEVTPKAISKLSAIETLLNGNDTLNDVIAFGDNYNDDGMLRHTGYGVAVGNAREEIKAIADYITLKNTENGVAHFLNLHFKI